MRYFLLKPFGDLFLICLGTDHPQGQGQLNAIPCDVTFYVFLPVNRQICPYAVFVSYGVHSHCPPPPNRAPQEHLDDVLDIIRRMEDPRMTLGKFFSL